MNDAGGKQVEREQPKMKDDPMYGPIRILLTDVAILVAKRKGLEAPGIDELYTAAIGVIAKLRTASAPEGKQVQHEFDAWYDPTAMAELFKHHGFIAVADAAFRAGNRAASTPEAAGVSDGSLLAAVHDAPKQT